MLPIFRFSDIPIFGASIWGFLNSCNFGPFTMFPIMTCSCIQTHNTKPLNVFKRLNPHIWLVFEGLRGCKWRRCSYSYQHHEVEYNETDEEWLSAPSEVFSGLLLYVFWTFFFQTSEGSQNSCNFQFPCSIFKEGKETWLPPGFGLSSVVRS